MGIYNGENGEKWEKNGEKLGKNGENMGISRSKNGCFTLVQPAS